MFIVYQSHRQEALLEQLLLGLRSPADANPLARDIIVCERGIDRWLWQEMAVREGIAFNLQPTPPASFIWQTLRTLYPQPAGSSGWEAGALGWRIFECLGSELVQTPAFAPVRGYLADDPGQRKRHQLAQRLESLFDQYLVYRHAMVVGWEQGRLCLPGNADEPWQAALWRTLAAGAAGQHRARLLQCFFDDLAAQRLPGAQLPLRVSVFAVPALPPAYLNVLRALGRQITVELYLLSPSSAFWHENQTPREQLATLAQFGDYGDRAALYLDQHNPLLANGAARIQQFHRALLEDGELDSVHELEDGTLPGHALGRLQRDILDNEPPKPASLPAFDASVQIHGCYSLLREIEVLHDRLLDAFSRDASLQPHEVLVLTPNIDSAAPYINAVFEAATGERRIPYAIADTARAAAHPLLGAFHQLLGLPEARLTASEVFALLEVPALARAFGLADAQQLGALRRLVAEAGVRWGRDAADRARQGLPGLTTHTWEFGLRRLFLGLTVADTSALVEGWAPVGNVAGTDAELLGKLEHCLDTLQHWRGTLAREQTPEAWSAHLTRLQQQCFKAEAADELQALELIADAVREFHDETSAAGLRAEIPAAVLRADFERRLEQSAGDSGFLTGAVTFARLTAARSLPFRMICLIGMNHDAFPRRESPLAFDLVAARPQPGDRSRREDDRHLFLETLLSARDCFYLSFVDRSLRDSSRLEPSVVVSELIDTLLDMHCPPNATLPTRLAARQTLVVQHPMHAFSARQYDGSDDRLFSYDPDWLPVAHAAGASRRSATAFCPAPLPAAAPAGEIRLEDLKRCLRHPVKWFLHRRLGVTLDQHGGVVLEDDEPFALANDFDVNDAWLAQALVVNDVDAAAETFEQTLLANGSLPAGRFGSLDWAERRDALAGIVSRLRQEGAAYAPRSLEYTLADGRRLVGSVAAVAGRRCRSVTSSTQTHARLLLDAWLDQLALTVATGEPHDTQIETATGQASLAGVALAEAVTHLEGLVALYDRSLTAPLRFFPKSALAYATRARAGKPESGLKDARSKWFPRLQRDEEKSFPSESEDRSYALCFGHEPDPLESPLFVELATAVFDPLLGVFGGDLADDAP